MPKEGDAPLKLWRTRYKALLDAIFQDVGSAGFVLTPDNALDLMDEILSRSLTTEEQPEATKAPNIRRADALAWAQEAHHYAVDLFYKTYFGTGKKGRPSLSQEQLDQVLTLRRRELSYGRIAKMLGLTNDATRKRVKQVERLWAEKAREINELAVKLNLIASTPNHDTDPQ